MKFDLIGYDNLMNKIRLKKPLEEKLSLIVRHIEKEFHFTSLGVFLQVPKSAIFRLKIGRNLSHTFSKSTIFTEGDPLLKDLAKNEILDMRFPGTYAFEHEYSHLIICSLCFHEKLLGFIFLDRSNGYFESEDLTKFHIFASQITLSVFIDWHIEEMKQHRFDDQQVPIYDHKEFMERGKTVFSMMKRYKRYMTMIAFKIEGYRNLSRIYGEKKTLKYLDEIKNIFARNLRDTDFIGQLEKDTIIMLMPETPQKNAMITIERLKSYLTDLHTLKFGKHGWGISTMDSKFKSFEDMVKFTLEAALDSARRSKGIPQIISET